MCVWVHCQIGTRAVVRGICCTLSLSLALKEQLSSPLASAKTLCVCQCLLSPTETRGQGMGTTMYGAWSLDLQARKAQQRHFLAFWHGARTEAPMRMPRRANGGQWRIPGTPAGRQPSHRRYFPRHRRLTTPQTPSVEISTETETCAGLQCDGQNGTSPMPEPEECLSPLPEDRSLPRLRRRCLVALLV